MGAGAVTNHGLQRQWRNNRKNPTSSAGNDGKLWELAVALPALPDTSHSGVEENKQQGDLSQGCILPFPYPNPWEQRKPRADGCRSKGKAATLDSRGCGSRFPDGRNDFTVFSVLNEIQLYPLPHHLPNLQGKPTQALPVMSPSSGGGQLWRISDSRVKEISFLADKFEM